MKKYWMIVSDEDGAFFGVNDDGTIFYGKNFSPERLKKRMRNNILVPLLTIIMWK